VLVKGKRLEFMDTNSVQRTVGFSYGIMTILQLRHVAALKHHYPSTIFESITVPRGRYRGGTPRLGEVEIMSIIMQMLPACVRDVINKSDKCTTDICSGCFRLIINCDCPRLKPPPRQV
jgi:hypothetical protein